MSTLQDIRLKTRSNYIKIDTNGKIWWDNTLDSIINRAYFQLQKDWWHKRPQQYANNTQNTIGGTQEYDLPSNFIKLDLARYEWQELSKASKSDIKRIYATMTNGKPYAYYIYGTKIWLFPVPDTIGVLDLDYYKKLEKLSSTQDSELPEEFDDAICAYSAYLAFNSVNKTDKASIMYADYQWQLNTLLNSYIYNDDNFDFWYQTASYRPSETSVRNLF